MKESLGRDEMLAAGITYRQLDYWCRTGWLLPLQASPGSGKRRFFPPAELKVARSMLLLINAGIAPPVAARAAREGVDLGRQSGALDASVYVVWREAPEDTHVVTPNKPKRTEL